MSSACAASRLTAGRKRAKTPTPAFRILGLTSDQRPHVGGFGVEREARWHDADHRARAIVERQTLSDDVRCGAEAVLPEAMGEHDGATLREIVAAERATHRRRHAEQGEEVNRRGDCEHHARRPAPAQDLFARGPRSCRNRLEAAAVLFPGFEILE